MSFRKLKTAASGTFGIASKGGAASEADAVLLRTVFAMVNRIHETAVFPNMVLAEWDQFDFYSAQEIIPGSLFPDWIMDRLAHSARLL
jgi:hypothetical protein